MRILAALFAFATALPASSHEFWIEPPAYQIEADGIIRGELVNGQEFIGSQLAYLPQRFERFTVASGMRQANVENRLGARPALDIAPLAEGLHAISYQSRLSTISYAEWEKFVNFAEHKDFADYEDLHDARGLPREGFTEGYWRFAKTLVGVGHSAGNDFRTGLATEFVALDNPYTADLTNGLRVQLYFLDDTLADGQVELFEKAPNGTVDITLHRTNEDGIAVLPVKAGHSYLVDHVILREPSAQLAQQADIEWETLWAALTFGVPE
ncbi:DUF4198 domain-containing protein [Octadecabacter sp. G9-8]|uniref:DUF4198 domain-containing protein n=1 Tax=Octadecabacter dasysiphoniae TaxID=2909341 RepID=A0ABS9CTS7_9RHOB|nr:DUF4198 domain-containing protein [Octadecabacter dasysiphoniae]MCF2870638.1 DUF4198 domain-containing protein [Octadecabacter dasysiphoniae]